jgi:Tol biopolymer transport system component
MSVWRVAVDEASGRLLAPAEALTVPALWSGGLDVGRDGRHLVYATAEPRSSIQRVAFDPVRGALLGAPVPVIGGSRIINFHAVSPDGQWIAFTSGGLRENLFLVRADGTGYRQLTDDQFRNRGPDWAPDGERIAFFSDRSGRYEAWAIRPDGSGLEQLTDVTDGTLTVPRWSPDGSRMATNGPPFRLFDLRRPLKDRVIGTLPPIGGGLVFAGAEWSPDGQHLAGWGMRDDGSRADLFVYDLATESYQSTGRPGSGPSWLSDGRRLLYSSLEGALVLLDLRSGSTKELLPRGSISTSFFWPSRITRDGRVITFQHDSAEGDVWMMNLE